MVAHVALLGLGPAGWAAFTVVTVVLIAGASGTFDQRDVDDSDYDRDGIYIPPYPDGIPNVDESGTTVPVHPDDDHDGNVTVDRYDEGWSVALPYSYICVYMSQIDGDDYDPDVPDDIRPPSSSFTVAGGAYDSGIGLYIAALTAFILTYWGVRELLGGVV